MRFRPSLRLTLSSIILALTTILSPISALAANHQPHLPPRVLPPPRCALILEGRTFQHQAELAEMDKDFIVQAQSVEDGGLLSLEDPNGPRVLLRFGRSWRSNYIPPDMPMARQGDGRRFMQFFADPITYLHFYFWMLSSREMQAPTGDLMDGALQNLNPFLPTEFQNTLRYHTSKGLMKPRQFVKDWIYLILPLSGIGYEMVHDLAFHTLSWLIPTSILNISRWRVHYFVEFEKFVKDKHPELWEQVEARFDRGYDLVTRKIDRANGNFARRITMNDYDGAATQLKSLAFNGHSPQFILRWILDLNHEPSGLHLKERRSYQTSVKLLDEYESTLVGDVAYKQTFNLEPWRYTLKSFIEERRQAVHVAVRLYNQDQQP